MTSMANNPSNSLGSAANSALQSGGLGRNGGKVTLSNRAEQIVVNSPAAAGSAISAAANFGARAVLGATVGANHSAAQSLLSMPAVNKVGLRSSIAMPVLAGALASKSGAASTVASLGLNTASIVLSALGKMVPGAGKVASLAMPKMPHA